MPIVMTYVGKIIVRMLLHIYDERDLFKLVHNPEIKKNPIIKKGISATDSIS